MTSAVDIVYRVIDALEGLSIPYMLVGSFSSNLYGVARSTKDADFVVELGDVSPSRVALALGPEFHLDPQMSFETVTGTYRYIVTHRASAFKVEFFLLSGDAHDKERFARRRREAMPVKESFVASAEDVVITKLRWSKGGNRKKDVDDVRNVIHVQASSLDWPYIEKWCETHGTLSLLEQTRREASQDAHD